MIPTKEFRKNLTKILYKDEPWLVTDFQHVKPGKGGAFLKTKLKNLITGLTLEVTFRAEEKLEAPDLSYSKMQYAYSDNGIYNFIDQESYEQLSFSVDQLGNTVKYIKEGVIYQVDFFKGKAISVQAPNHMELKVKETVPGVKGNTAQGGSKQATLETGLIIMVPLFINEGDTLKIDTREDLYIERM